MSRHGLPKILFYNYGQCPRRQLRLCYFYEIPLRTAVVRNNITTGDELVTGKARLILRSRAHIPPERRATLELS